MRRIFLLAAVLTMGLVACTSGEEGAATTAATLDEPGVTSTLPSGGDTTVPPTDGVTTTSAPEVTGTTSDRPLAPDFTLQLGEGGEYTLSDGEKPVYLVFWAEW